MSSDLLKNIYLATLEFMQPVTLEERCRVAVTQAVKVAGAEYGTIFLGNKNGELVSAYSNVPKIRNAPLRNNGFTHKAFITRNLYVVSPYVLRKFHKEELYDKGVRSLILIPLSFNKKIVGVLSLQTNITKKLTHESTNALNLFGSLISLGIHNSQLYEQSLEAVKARDLFISLASHELKTPLTTISAYADLISKKINSKQTPPEKSIEILNSEIKRMKHMLNEFLTIDQIKMGQLRYKWKEINIVHILERSIINFKFSYPGYKVVIENSLEHHDYMLQGDNEKLQQVLTNLFNNAAKFSSRSTPIIVSLKKEEKYFVISITDYGKGIRKKEQNLAFQEFFKADGNIREGMGLGLYIVKNIIEKHQGIVLLDSKLHKGTTIVIKLPQKLYEP